MALTLTKLQGYVTHALGGSPASEWTSAEIVNNAGEFLFSMHDWLWRMRPPVKLALVSGQEYVSLPFDFGEIAAEFMTDGLNEGLSLTTPQNLLMLRSTTVNSTAHYWASVFYPAQVNRKSAPPPPRLEIWPTPSATDSTAITLVYRAGWVELVDSDDVANVPRWMGSLLIELVRAFAQGWEEDMDVTLTPRVSEVLMGPIAERLMQRDGNAMHTLGEMTNGAVQMIYGRERLPFDAVANPS